MSPFADGIVLESPRMGLRVRHGRCTIRETGGKWGTSQNYRDALSSPVHSSLHAPALRLSARYRPACVGADETPGLIANVDRASINVRVINDSCRCFTRDTRAAITRPQRARVFLIVDDLKSFASTENGLVNFATNK